MKFLLSSLLLISSYIQLMAQTTSAPFSAGVVYFVNAKDCISCLTGIRQDFNEVAANNTHEIYTNVDSASFAQIAQEYQLRVQPNSIVLYKKNYNLSKSGYYSLNDKRILSEQSADYYKKGFFSSLDKGQFKNVVKLPETHSLLSTNVIYSTHSIAWYCYNLNRAFNFNIKDSSISVFMPNKASLSDFKKFDTSLANPNNEYYLEQLKMDKVYINGLTYENEISHYFLVNMVVEIKGKSAAMKGSPFYVRHNKGGLKDTFKLSPYIKLKGEEYYYEPSAGMVFLNDTVMAAFGGRNSKEMIMKGFYTKDKDSELQFFNDFRPFRVKQEFLYSNGIMLVDNKSVIDAKGNLLFTVPSKFRRKGWYCTGINYAASEGIVKTVFRNKNQMRLLSFSLSNKGQTYFQRNYEVTFTENFLPGFNPVSGSLFIITDKELLY